MTHISDFSADEVAQLLDAPGVVLKAMTVADGPPGVGSFFKAAARSAKAFRAAQKGENEFVRTLALALRDQPKAESEAEEGDGEPGESTDFLQPDPEAEADRAVEAASASASLLRGRAEETDIKAYAAWILDVATQVAEATTSREGGLFGRRVRITPAEQALLDRLTVALTA